ncbi:uncharacterized protein YjiK [Pseudomonas duriflava]|uniref:Uncharacterized protein YjiK n=1 Tax=Pseudomonas duriflava TaxID=459528 RepID=A0A562Q7X5_9PSED|nr:SdiA-regulated domain-containing protein [Pseudomonas duriflava]TWI52280.1 uncharacterized protein YjiK [Pseudomonas duriflava]
MTTQRLVVWRTTLRHPSPRFMAAAALCVVLGSLFIVQEQRLFDRLWYSVQERWYAKEWKERSLWLPAYQVDIEAKPIPGNRDFSAATFDPSRQTLVTLTNKDSEFVELSLEGDVLRRIPMRGFSDPEAIEYISPGVYIVVEERSQRLVQIHVDEHTRVIDVNDPVNQTQFSLNVSKPDNKGFEGLAYDYQHKRLFVAKEMDPVQIYEIDGFAGTHPEQPMEIRLYTDTQRDSGLLVKDLSSLAFDSDSGHLLALSDESKKVIELDKESLPVGSMSLEAGEHGLNLDVPQAEGMTLDDQGRLYVISEPNLFYRFSKR